MFQELTEQERREVTGGVSSLNTIAPLQTAWVVAAPRTPAGLGKSTRFVSTGQKYDAYTLFGGWAF